jgi:hypothetical protein
VTCSLGRAFCRRRLIPSLKKGQQDEIEIWASSLQSNLQTKNPKVEALLEREKLMDNRIVVSEDLHGAHKLVRYTNKILSKGRPGFVWEADASLELQSRSSFSGSPGLEAGTPSNS